MRTKYLLIPLVSVMLIFSCKKNNTAEDKVTVSLNSCVQQNFAGSEQITICLDSIIEDSRCPHHINCIWQGEAIAKFSFKRNGSAYPFTLSTLSGSGSYPNDVTLFSYKIKFVDLNPYPDLSSPPVPASQVKADLSITRL
jgi:hypothetical protein